MRLAVHRGLLLCVARGSEPARKSGGAQADKQLAHGLGATDGRREVPLRTCDRRTAEVVRVGGELVSMTGDILELSVKRPPTTDQAALALAREHSSYAPAIVQPGTGDVETLAAILKDARAWYFWWD